MLHCVYHISQPFRVVEDDEKEALLATGDWFDHPNKPKENQKLKEEQKEEEIEHEIQPKKRGRHAKKLPS